MPSKIYNRKSGVSIDEYVSRITDIIVPHGYKNHTLREIEIPLEVEVIFECRDIGGILANFAKDGSGHNYFNPDITDETFGGNVMLTYLGFDHNRLKNIDTKMIDIFDPAKKNP